MSNILVFGNPRQAETIEIIELCFNYTINSINYIERERESESEIQDALI